MVVGWCVWFYQQLFSARTSTYPSPVTVSQYADAYYTVLGSRVFDSRPSRFSISQAGRIASLSS